ncbi:MAG TPA: precorrin-2 C(20)-methyltransferase [Candidatus Egerieimonas intestinavium]|uniref:Precorrin-2 C(20)-methyltransferase n=1 Tax=Candidatus Egerieimonas intestinavium TaxID=2840777 RepID=A0A9D1EL20_9FIRM|nr:precorrin-2 C(20)-methyltransferase [Candidatus Egerieimonas intestinavium]
MTGTLYGVGVGPGDPELLTLKALRLIRESQVIAVPGASVTETVAYKIVKQAYPALDEKELIGLEMPMTKDEKLLKESHDRAAAAVEECLRAGKDVAFLTLGDPTVYSTYLYVHKRVEADGFPVEIISGITSFCAVAARMNMGLVEKSQPLHVIPASYQIQDALKLSGTKVLMKAGRKMGEVKRQLLEQPGEVVMIENCGMEKERCYRGAEEIPEEAGYYSLIIVKEEL